MALHAYVKEMHGSRSKIPSTKSRAYIHISRLRVKKFEKQSIEYGNIMPKHAEAAIHN